MCGIVGGFGSKVNDDWVQQQTVKLKYRGPDFQKDLKISETLHVGSARLSMTDPLPRSNQPFESKRSVIVFNGEIYNYKELKLKLESKGVEFSTSSDTEVLQKAIEIWGDRATTEIEGMYAFAYFDKIKELLILGRDPLGKKPLYFSTTENSIHWSSSLNSMKDFFHDFEVNNQALSEYLTLGYTLDPETMFFGIQSVQPGRFLHFELSNYKVKLKKETRITIRKPRSNRDKSIRENIKLAVASRLEGHRSAAISLSGGLDSSIVALLASETDTTVTGYSASWPDSDKQRYNEDSQAAREIAKNIGIQYEEVEIFKAKDLDQNLRLYIKAMQEPNSNPSGLSMMNLYKSISNDGFRLVLTGDGADEILGGYPRYKALSRIPKLLNLESKNISHYLEKERTNANKRIMQFLISQSSNKTLDNWFHWHWNFTPQEIGLLFPTLFSSLNSKTLREKINLSSLDYGANAIAFNMNLDREIWLGMESNRKLDRISMFYSIEARSPFQDERVIDAALDYMEETKFKKIGKQLLWEVFPEMEALGVRKNKSGFISPVGHWLRENPTLVDQKIETLDKFLPLSKSHLQQIKTYPHSGNFRKIMQVWSLIVLSYWLADSE
jgi:asparagine synthase (glutamine-hydrolysing)